MDVVRASSPLESGAQPLSPDDYLDVTYGHRPMRPAAAARARMDAFHASLRRQLEGGRRIYGVNTGYGADSVTVIPPDVIRRVQRNTLLSHATGTGAPVSEPLVRGMLRYW